MTIPDPARAVAEHLRDHTDADAVIVGRSDEVIAAALAAGWTLSERTDIIAGCRIRYISPPPQCPVPAIPRKDTPPCSVT